MDGIFGGLCSATSETRFIHPEFRIHLDQNLGTRLRISDTLLEQNDVASPPKQPESNPATAVPLPEDDSCKGHDLSDVVRKYISLSPNSPVPSAEDDSCTVLDRNMQVVKYIGQMLMEDDIEEKVSLFQGSEALQAEERSFYEALGAKYPLSETNKSPDFSQNGNLVVGGRADGLFDSSNKPPDLSQNRNLDGDFCDHGQFDRNNKSPDFSQNGSSVGGCRDHWQFDSSNHEDRHSHAPKSSYVPPNNAKINSVGKYENKKLPEGSRGKKNLHDEGVDPQEERSNKQTAVYSESTIRSEMFDLVLLCSEGINECAFCKTLRTGSAENTLEDGRTKGSGRRKARVKKKRSKGSVVDITTLLTVCAQAVASSEYTTAKDFLKLIRQHASPSGDGMQRLAHYFADGLEARMAGSGTRIYKDLISAPASSSDVLRAYHVFLGTCPFRKISNFFSNKTIMNIAEKATRLHIIDFGLLYGFQWPSLIQRLSARPGGPPMLRITGIDFPHPGFRPAEKVLERGRRLSSYAESFKVPFEFNAIAQKWETIKIEDLNIDKDEILVVNCLYRFRNLLDETVDMNSPRDMVLNLIRKMNPNIFIQGVVNGAYNAPFFATRFREALFHYSALFDMLEANIPREIHERLLIERTIFGREAMDVIACEAAERIERPETYKQWQVRNLRARFRQLPINEDIVKMIKEWVKVSYHKDFVTDENCNWLLQGWKGRIVYALSSWIPDC